METNKEKANKIRLELMGCSDSDLVYFAQAVDLGDINQKDFESVSEFVKRVADEHLLSMPF